MLTTIANFYYANSPPDANSSKDVNSLEEVDLPNDIASPEDVNSTEDVDSPVDVDSPEEADYFAQLSGELGLGFSVRMLRGGKLIFSDLLELNLENSNETSYSGH